MFKFIHAADVHLDSPQHKLDRYEGAPADALRHSTRRAFENLIGLALSQKVAFILIAGDLYDGDWKDYNTGLYLVSQLTKLRDSGIRVFIVGGNHDAANKMTKALRLPDNVTMFPAEDPATVILEDIGVAVHGQSFLTPAVKKNLAAGFPRGLPGYFNIGLLHTCATGREDHEPYAPCSLDDLKSREYRYWALGHIHRREVLLTEPWSGFPGNLQGRHIREAGPKGCLLVSVEDGPDPNPRFEPLDVVRWVKIRRDVSRAESANDVLDSIRSEFESLPEENDGIPLIARIELTGICRAHDQLAADPEWWSNEVRSAALDAASQGIWVEKVVIRTRPPGTGNGPGSIDGPVGELSRYLDELCTDQGRLQELLGPLHELFKKLPGELRRGPNAGFFEDEGRLADLVEQVRPMLISRLIKKGQES